MTSTTTTGSVRESGEERLPSYWHATAGTSSAGGPLPATSDVVVVGGGLLGSCTAYWLARQGAKVTIVERTAPAAGATGRNGGFLTSGTAESYPDAVARLGREAARAVWDLTIENRALVRQVLAEERIDCDYREPGHLSLALGEEQLADARRVAAAMNAEGYRVEALDRAQAQELFGTPLGPEVSGGLLGPESGLLHSARFVHGVVAAAIRHGARLSIAEVRGIARDGEGVSLETSGGRLRAGAVVVATNAWTGRVFPALSEVVRPVRGQVLAYAPAAPVFRLGIGAEVTPTGEYWQQTLDGSIVLGGCRAAAPGRDEGVWEQETTPEVQQALEGVFPRLFPDLTGLRVARRWAGLMAFTPDYLPVADQAPELPGAWVVGGFCGHGMPFGMRLGQLLAQAALERETPAALAPLRLGRPTLRG
jgi:gamma-glutamylputrescine oxidase